MAAEHFKNPMSAKMVVGYTSGDFLLFAPDGTEDYRVGVEKISMERDVATKSEILWLTLHDGRQVRIKIPTIMTMDVHKW